LEANISKQLQWSSVLILGTLCSCPRVPVFLSLGSMFSSQKQCAILGCLCSYLRTQCYWPWVSVFLALGPSVLVLGPLCLIIGSLCSCPWVLNSHPGFLVFLPWVFVFLCWSLSSYPWVFFLIFVFLFPILGCLKGHLFVL
jgi:hypothetical protein